MLPEHRQHHGAAVRRFEKRFDLRDGLVPPAQLGVRYPEVEMRLLKRRIDFERMTQPLHRVTVAIREGQQAAVSRADDERQGVELFGAPRPAARARAIRPAIRRTQRHPPAYTRPPDQRRRARSHILADGSLEVLDRPGEAFRRALGQVEQSAHVRFVRAWIGGVPLLEALPLGPRQSQPQLSTTS